MSKVVVNVSVSIDGFMTGPNVRPEEPMGDGGERLHAWMDGSGPGGAADLAARREVDAGVGAAVVGRRTFDLGLPFWGGTPWAGAPAFVVTHRRQPDFEGANGGLFSFDDLRGAIRRAKTAAGDKDVQLMGGEVTRQALTAGLVDEFLIHVVPILLGGGTRLFEGGERAELVPDGAQTFGSVAHFRLRVARLGPT